MGELLFLSTLSLRRATPSVLHSFRPLQISIHALLAESDRKIRPVAPDISSFLSTLSLRRATRVLECTYNAYVDFYPRSPCGERRSARPETRRPDAISIHALLAESDYFVCQSAGAGWLISIHALLAESDVDEIPYQRQINQFLSTLSLRRATLRVLDGSKSSIISIHALLAESDETSSR